MIADLDTLKQAVGEKSDADDARLARILSAASSFCESYCGRVFEQTTYTSEMYDGNGTDTLILRNFPIISVSSLKECGATLTTGTDPAAGPDVLIYAEAGKLVRPFGMWLPYRRWYSVTYSAGYAVVPPSIVQACIDVAMLMLREKDRAGVAAETMGTRTSQFLRSLPEASQRALDLYRDATLRAA